ncbi:uncharacterized protein LOC111699454 [Eurytemora carolleeae]|uniref:uncharacterized protein LOC111699454 n=1 Tax=Eurytemora carolleeae TaxID=1294199 RepID=UPI000C7832E2|nr:uncharacterized protein LOC111699454 [Eurytemora carolleeae]|eukprot:XP_023325904.1 uncharacterized protein LOC111699454 [Eurytemora affinis]
MCQICSDGQEGLLQYSFLCPNGTIFNQQYFICDWWFNVDCSTAEDFFYLNAEVAEAAALANERREGRASNLVLPIVQERPVNNRKPSSLRG